MTRFTKSKYGRWNSGNSREKYWLSHQNLLNRLAYRMGCWSWQRTNFVVALICVIGLSAMTSIIYFASQSSNSTYSNSAGGSPIRQATCYVAFHGNETIGEFCNQSIPAIWFRNIKWCYNMYQDNNLFITYCLVEL